jgi:hypothetical protein
MDHEVFPIARGSSAPLWFCGVIGVLVFALGAFLGTLFFLASRIVMLDVSDRGVRVRGDVYARFIASNELQVDHAALVDLASAPQYKPVARTNGVGLPDYESGWFRLANGSNALLFVTNWSRAVRVPTTAGYDLLVSPSDPPAFLAALKRPTATAVTFPMAQPQARSSSALTWLMPIPIVLLPLALSGLMGYLAYSIRHVTFTLSDEGLRVRGDFFGRLIPRSSLCIDDAKRVDLKQEKTLQPVLRMMGAGLPGYNSGWFRLRDRRKALLFLTDRSRTVCVPTNDGYTLLISPADPERFLAALQATRVDLGLG